MSFLEHSPQDVLRQGAYAQAMFESIGDGAIVTDEKGIIRQINNGALKMLKIDKEEILNKWFPEVIKAQDESGRTIAPINRPITKSFLSGAAVSEKIFYVLQNGEKIAVDITVSPIILNDEPVGAVEIMRDITKEKEIDQMKTDFISIASHQLRTPLTALKTYTHILEGEIEDRLNPRCKNHLGIIHNSILRMNEIISMLLNISRIEAGLLEVRIKRTDLKRLVENLMQELHTLADEKNVQLSCSTGEESVYENTDPVIFIEILSNLVTNAIKYTNPGGHVTVNLGKRNGRATISVEDSGMGIPSHLQNKIFTKFFRSPIATQADVSGNGLGLYMAKQMADALKGDLYFHSKEGKGSTFYFSFPK